MILGRVAQGLAVALGRSAVRIANAQGRGVIETAIQNAAVEVAERYVRSVRP